MEQMEDIVNSKVAKIPGEYLIGCLFLFWDFNSITNFEKYANFCTYRHLDSSSLDSLEVFILNK